MAITYLNNIIDVRYEPSDAHGDSFENPFTPEDIYQASVAGGWNIVER